MGRDQEGDISSAGGLRASQQKVVVIVKTYRQQVQALQELMASLDDQKVQGCESQCVSFIIVPTEAADLSYFRFLVKSMDASFDAVIPPNLDFPFFNTMKANSPNCSITQIGPTFKEDFCGPYRNIDKDCDLLIANPDYEQDLFKTVCGRNNFLHFSAVDLAIDYAITRFRDKNTFVLITNGDNSYAPRFLTATTRTIIDNGLDLVATHFDTPRTGRVTTQYVPGKIKSGAALIRLGVLEKYNLRFENSVHRPMKSHNNVAMMRAQHDADFWFFRKLVNDLNVSRAMIPDVLFHHH